MSDMTGKPIRMRLENWGKWATARANRGPDSMTGAVCERMRKAALGNVWSGHDVRDPVDEDDAVMIELAWRALRQPHKEILWCSFIGNMAPEMICRRMRLPIRPVSVFATWFEHALVEIEKSLDTVKILVNNHDHNLTPGNAETASQGRIAARRNESLTD